MERRGFLATGSVSVLGGLAGCFDAVRPMTDESLTARGEWPRPEYDPGATGQNDRVAGPTTKPDVRWEADAPVDSVHKPAVVVADETVFVAGGSTVTALDIADGSTRWQRQVAAEQTPGTGAGYHCSATVDDDHVYVGTHEGLTVLTRDGEDAWSHNVAVEPGESGVFRSPAVVDDTVFFCTALERTIYAYSTDGDQQWQYELEEPIFGGPAVVHGRVFVSEPGVGLHAISTAGEPLWTNEIDKGGNTRAITPTVYDGTVYTAGVDSGTGFLGAYDAATGTEGWTTPAGLSVIGSPAVRDVGETGQLVVPAWTGSIFMFDLDDGSLQAGSHIGNGTTVMVPNPAVDEDGVYVAGGDGVSRFGYRDRDWHRSIDGAAGNVAVVDGAMFVGSVRGRCYALA